jgi:SAM-dependent methyltransferase
MEASKYYDEKTTWRRKLCDGDGIRNTHNFIKAVLIETFVRPHSHVLDLGCGQGGDLLKFRRLKLRSYRGIDISHTAIEAISNRIYTVNLPCRVKLECVDFSKHDWPTASRVDAVSCQFAIQYAFSSFESAQHVISRISKVLNDGGVFVATMPLHDQPTYTPVSVTLPGDSRQCLEYSVQKHDLVKICSVHDLHLHLWKPFVQFCEESKVTHANLYGIMRASMPSPENVVFVFKKSSADE